MIFPQHRLGGRHVTITLPWCVSCFRAALQRIFRTTSRGPHLSFGQPVKVMQRLCRSFAMREPLKRLPTRGENTGHIVSEVGLQFLALLEFLAPSLWLMSS